MNVPSAVRRAIFTRDDRQTLDRYTLDQQLAARQRDSSGVFLIGELERLDPTVHEPLYSVSWARDIKLREDVTLGDEFSSFSQTNFAAPGGIPGSNKAWIGKAQNALVGVDLDISKTINPLPAWGMELSWTLFELESSRQQGRPVDMQKFDAMRTKYQMDIDEQVYVGDNALGLTGLLNSAAVTNVGNATALGWAALINSSPTTAQQLILTAVNELLNSAYVASGYTIVPDQLRLPPLQFSLLASTMVNTAGNESIISFLERSSICNAYNGRPLNIKPLKWLTGTTAGGVGPGAGGADRMMAYTNQKNFVRFPLVPLTRTPLEYRSIRQNVVYYGRLGQVEVVYSETIAYRDGI